MCNSFSGFPDHMYKAQYPSKGDPKLASHILDLLSAADIKAEGVKRGLDHGVWAGFHVGMSPSLTISCAFTDPPQQPSTPWRTP